MERVRVKKGGGSTRVEVKSAQDYFMRKTDVEFFSTGCVVLDCALGGGYAERRVINIVGDRSSGKTLLGIEACANFVLAHEDGLIRYDEGESAFDTSYAEVLGMPLDKVDFEDPSETAEEFGASLNKFAEKCKIKGVRGLYVLDSLDSLSDDAEKKKDDDESGYGTAKAKYLSKLFRKNNRTWGASGVTLIVISQIRDKINVTFGRKYVRAGGKALDFYASQILFLAEVDKVKRTVRGVQRATGINVKGRVEKNKAGVPFREATFPLMFGYGVNDLEASLRWLESAKLLDEVDVKNVPRAVEKYLQDKKFKRRVSEVVRKHWFDIEREFMPTVRKYE